MNNRPRIKEEGSCNFINRFLDVIFISSALYASIKLQGEVVTTNYIFLLFMVLATYLYTAESVQLYRYRHVNNLAGNVWLVIFSLCVSFSAMLTITFAFKVTAVFSRLILGWWFAIALVALVITREVTRNLRKTMYKKGIGTRRAAIIGYNDNAESLIIEMKRHPEVGLNFCGIYDDRTPERLGCATNKIIGSVEDCLEAAHNGLIDRIYITLPFSADKRIAEIIHVMGDTTVDVHIVPDSLVYNLMLARLGSVGNVETISVFESPYYGARDWIKRSFDVVFSATALLFLTPFLLIIATAIKLTSRGPVFFKQDRYGLDGRRIKVYKFRSMSVQENGDKVVQATKGDARITPLGGFLRRTSLDELPQFINVLQGSMSVVGPRPHAVAHNEQYRKLVAFYMLRHKVKPGITGWAQINGWRGETDTLEKMEKRVEYDLAYIKNWSLWWDAKIVFLTFFRGFTGKNVY